MIEASFAAQAHIGLGDVVTVESVDAPAAPMRVIGIADTADQGFYPQWTPGLIWVLPTLLAKVEPSASETENVIGVRLANPTAQNTALFVQNVYNYFNNASESSVVERLDPPGGHELHGEQRPPAGPAARPRSAASPWWRRRARSRT